MTDPSAARIYRKSGTHLKILGHEKDDTKEVPCRALTQGPQYKMVDLDTVVYSPMFKTFKHNIAYNWLYYHIRSHKTSMPGS